MEPLAYKSGVKFTHVPCKGSGPAIQDVIGGQVDMMLDTTVVAAPHIQSGKLRAIAIAIAPASGPVPDVPTVAESGFKGFDVSTWYGVFAPAGTPASVVNAVNAEVNKLLATADMKAAINAQGAEPEAMTPAQFGTLLKTEYTQWKGIVEASGAKIE